MFIGSLLGLSFRGFISRPGLTFILSLSAVSLATLTGIKQMTGLLKENTSLLVFARGLSGLWRRKAGLFRRDDALGQV